MSESLKRAAHRSGASCGQELPGDHEPSRHDGAADAVAWEVWEGEAPPRSGERADRR